MSVTWSLTVNGTLLGTLTQLNITRCTITRRNLAVSEMRFSVETPDISVEPFCVYNDIVRLIRTENAVSVYWFVGTVTALPATGEKDREMQSYVVSDAWYKLERIIYQQPYVYRSGDFTKFLGGYSSHITLGRDAWGNTKTPAQVITAIAAFANVASVSIVNIPVNMPLIEARDISCAEAIKRMVELTPDVVGWFEYGSGLAVLHIDRRIYLSIQTFNLAVADAGKQVEIIGDLGPRYDLQVRGVVLVFLTTGKDTNNKTWLQETRQTAGAITGEGVIFATIDLSAQGTQQPEAVPIGLATAYYNTLTTLQWQGSLMLREAECTRAIQISYVVNLTGGRPEWSVMKAVVQSTVEDLLSGTTEAELGPPNHLAAQDFVALMAHWRKLPKPSNFPSTQNNGTAGVPVVDGGVGPDPDHAPVANSDAGGPSFVGVFPYVDVDYCKDGAVRTLRAVGLDVTGG